MKYTEKLADFLEKNKADYEILHHATPIRSTKDAAVYFDTLKAAPAFVLNSNIGLLVYIKSASRGKIDFNNIKALLQITDITMADPNIVRLHTKFKTGAVPLIGLCLPTIFDSTLLNFDYIYGGTGDLYSTLKISPHDAKRLNNIITVI